ncbi:MAG: hypothetical protein HZA95_01055 [Candidatus Vogelbacteria bacterium]|nr:hypothetical protein [Candidatus Vogelbacteria bacterium]
MQNFWNYLGKAFAALVLAVVVLTALVMFVGANHGLLTSGTEELILNGRRLLGATWSISRAVFIIGVMMIGLRFMWKKV